MVANAWVSRDVVLTDARRSVRRTVIRYDQFQVGVTLSEDGIDSVLQMPFPVEHRHANAELGGGVGVQIWQALEKPRSVAELCDSLLETFDVSRSKCEEDVLQLVSGLREEGLIEIAT